MKTILPIVMLLSVIATPFLAAGCGLFKLHSDLDDFQGHWVDVNGKTTLDFKGNTMTISYGSRKRSYKVRVEGEDHRSIVSADGKGFDLIGEISVESDGALTAYEQVLDAESYRYRFVREDRLEEENRIKDLSEDLPKEITSHEITSFELYFSLMDVRYDLPEQSPWQSGGYDFIVEKTSDGTYRMDFRGMGSSYVICSYSDTVSEEYVQGLAELIEQQKVAAQNGSHLTNNENYHGWFLYVDYASGEKIRISASGRPALSCSFSIHAFLEYANQVVRYRLDEE